MTRFMFILATAVVLAALASAGCDRGTKAKPAPPPRPAERTSWTAQEIAADPSGYLEWSARKIEQQIAEREKKLAAMSQRRSELEAKRKMLDQNIDDVQNIRRRLQEACQRAEDEDRWPTRVGEYAFTREKAQAVLAQTQQYVADREPLRKTYEEFFARMDQMGDSLRGDINELRRLRERMALDLEQVRLSQDMNKIEQLRQTEAQIESMSRAVASMSNDPTALAPPKEPPGRVNIDDMLK